MMRGKYENKDRADLISGRNPVIEALKQGKEIEKIMVAYGSEGSISKIWAMARDAGINVETVPRRRLNYLTGSGGHQGVAAVISAYEYASVEDILGKAEEKREDPFIIILDEIEDPHNLGAIIRTAECAGAHGVIIPKRRSCGLTLTVAKASAGAICSVPVAKVTNIGRTIDELKKSGVWTAACDMDGENCFVTRALEGSIAVVIGSEGRGVGELVRSKCDFIVSIPMYGKINSLNASNAAAVVMYEVRRRRFEYV